jgi:hypothetical protein
MAVQTKDVPTKAAAAIDVDSLLDRPLAELSAMEFIQALNHPKYASPSLGLIADKKKYELWVEEGVLGRYRLGDILQKLRGEKKKVELEVGPWFRNEPPFGRAQFEYGQLVEEIATRLEQRFNGR